VRFGAQERCIIINVENSSGLKKGSKEQHLFKMEINCTLHSLMINLMCPNIIGGVIVVVVRCTFDYPTKCMHKTLNVKLKCFPYFVFVTVALSEKGGAAFKTVYFPTV